MTRLLFVCNCPAFFVSHRLPIAEACIAAGYDVHVATATTDAGALAAITRVGAQHHGLLLDRSGTHPLHEARTFAQIFRLIHQLRPKILHLVTIKPVLYGGLAARVLGTPCRVAAISGMGHLFINEDRGIPRRLLEWAYRSALKHPNGRVIVQNPTDRDALRKLHSMPEEHNLLIPGSGVDLKTFTQAPLPTDAPQIVVMPARMLWTKGVGEFVAAARELRRQGVSARFVLVGPHDPHNPAGIPLEQLECWRENADVEWWGHRQDMPDVLAKATLVVLPSYREGLPKCLIEAAAVGRPIITTDTPGCRDTVNPGETGVLVPPRDAGALARAMGQLLSQPDKLRSMGRQARIKAEREFGLPRVVKRHLEIYEQLMAATGES